MPKHHTNRRAQNDFFSPTHLFESSADESSPLFSDAAISITRCGKSPEDERPVTAGQSLPGYPISTGEESVSGERIASRVRHRRPANKKYEIPTPLAATWAARVKGSRTGDAIGGRKPDDGPQKYGSKYTVLRRNMTVGATTRSEQSSRVWAGDLSRSPGGRSCAVM